MTDQEKKDVRSVLKSLALFLLPFLLVLVYPFMVMFLSGELMPVNSIIQKQQTAPSEVFVSLAYSDPTRFYKLKIAQKRGAKILALGTSRVMQVRSLFFSDPDSFYNAGGGISDLKDFRNFLNKIPVDKTPSLLIIGLDQRFFNPDWASLNGVGDNWPAPPGPASVFLNNWAKVYADTWQGKISFSTILSGRTANNAIGLSAQMRDMGFRKDGRE